MLKRSKEETLLDTVWQKQVLSEWVHVISSHSAREEVEMEDLSPPDHSGPPSLGRASR